MRQVNLVKFFLLFVLVLVLILLPILPDLLKAGPLLQICLTFLGLALMAVCYSMLRVDLFTSNWKDKDEEFITNRVDMSHLSKGQSLAMGLMLLIGFVSGILGFVKTMTGIFTGSLDLTAFGYFGIAILSMLSIKIAKEKPPTT